MWAFKTERTCRRNCVCSLSTGQGVMTQGPHKRSCRAKGDFRSWEAVRIVIGHQERHQCSGHPHTFEWLSCTLSQTALRFSSVYFAHSLWQCAGTVVVFSVILCLVSPDESRSYQLSMEFEEKISFVFNVSFLK